MLLILVRNLAFLWLWVGTLHELLYVWNMAPHKV
jgi:hypothetical protein